MIERPTLPAYFISHGAPTLPLDEGAPVHDFLSDLGRTIEGEAGGRAPEAILVVSAHWEAARATVGATAAPETIHDFRGFPAPLYDLTYPAPGAPDLARTVADRLEAAGIEAAVDATRGLDHGAWTPLMLLWPEARIPVLQLSVQTALGPDHHLALGRALAGLRDEGVLIVGSGSATHNLFEFRGQPADAPPPDWVERFAGWLAERIEADDEAAIAAYEQAPDGKRNHPTAEHFLPLFVPLGARTPGKAGQRLHHSYRYGILAMDVYRFD